MLIIYDFFTICYDFLIVTYTKKIINDKHNKDSYYGGIVAQMVRVSYLSQVSDL